MNEESSQPYDKAKVESAISKIMTGSVYTPDEDAHFRVCIRTAIFKKDDYTYIGSSNEDIADYVSRFKAEL